MGSIGYAASASTIVTIVLNCCVVCCMLQGWGTDTVENCVAAARLIHALLDMEDSVGDLRHVNPHLSPFQLLF